MRSANFLGPVCVFALIFSAAAFAGTKNAGSFDLGKWRDWDPSSFSLVTTKRNGQARAERSMSRSCRLARLSRPTKAELKPLANPSPYSAVTVKTMPSNHTNRIPRRSNLAVTRTHWYSLEERASGRHEGKERALAARSS